jgi:DNA-binding NarL/FixJ family response regulator
VSERIRVLLADDHQLVLEGLRSMLDAQPDMQVVGTCTSGAEVADAIRRTSPDVVALDLEMQPVGGLAALEQIRAAGLAVKVLVLTAYGDGGSMRAALERGADGYALKTESPRQTLESIRQVHRGHVVFPQAAKKWLMGGQQAPRDGNRLTERERAVLGLVAEGVSNAEIATRLRVSENTVKFHLQNVFLKLGVNNRTEAAARYLKDQSVF